jgi:hypothetical protein
MTKKLIYGITSAILLSTFVLIACSNTSSKSNSNSTKNGIELNWKLSENDSISYKTVMTEIGESSFGMDLGELFDKITDSTKTDKDQFGKDFFNKLKDHYNSTNLLTILSNSVDFKDVITIEMVLEEKANKKEDVEEDEANQMKKIMNSMTKGTMLRGSIYKNGALHSFWMKSSQKNLLSLFFELPEKPINKGDTWTLDNVNFIGNDQNFICRTAEKKNLITLIDIKEVEGETIAVIDYDILEYVSGDFNSPAFFGNEGGNKATTMKFIYKAQAEFSVDKGKWVSYNGIMSLNASGFMNSVQKKKFALIEQ